MHPEYDESAFDWIRCGRNERINSNHPGWVGNFVSHLMPPVFDAYAKVLHCIEASYENIDRPLTENEISILKLPPCEELKSLVQARRTEAQDLRIRWRELADLLHVPFAPEISQEWYRKRVAEGCWPRFLCGPDEGLLGPEECRELVSVLQPFTAPSGCFFRFAEMPLIETNKPRLFQGALNEAADFIESGGYQFSPEYWWPANRSWCVCSDYDLMFTVVGGSRNLISALLMSDALECVEATTQTRIDSFAPMPQA
jgi:hypothetical protein